MDNESIITKENKQKKYLGLLIPAITVYAVGLITMLCGFFSIVSTENSIGKAVGIVLFLVLFLCIIGGAATVISTVLSVIGAVKSIKSYKNGQTKKGICATFITFCILPVVTWVTIFVSVYVLSLL